MKTQEKKLPVVNSSETKALRNNRYEPLTDKEIREIRANPIASYLDVVRLTNLFDETRKELYKVQQLSSLHYQHHSDAMKMYWKTDEELKNKNKEIENKSKQIDELNILLKEAINKEEEANKSREFMCGEAGRHHNAKNEIIDYINSSNIIYTYDSVTKKNDTIVKFSKIEFDKFVSSAEHKDEGDS